MKNIRYISSGCAAFCALIPMVTAQDTAPEPLQVTAVETAGTLVTEKGALDQALLFVVDKVSADAAAPVVAQLVKAYADTMPREMLLSEYDHSLLAATSCYGSAALRAALATVYVPDSQYEAQLAPYLALQKELGSILEDMAAMLEKVRHKRSADAAAEMAQNVPAYIASLQEKAAVLPNQDDLTLQRARVRRYQVTVRPGAARLLRAWGKLMAKDADLYGSEYLMAAMPPLTEVLENLGMAADPAKLPQLVETAEKLEPLLVEWLQVSKNIKDTATADVAALRLLELGQQIRAVSVDKLGVGYERQLAHVSPRLQILMMATDRVSHWFDALPTPYYGSVALQQALAHEE